MTLCMCRNISSLPRKNHRSLRNLHPRPNFMHTPGNLPPSVCLPPSRLVPPPDCLPPGVRTCPPPLARSRSGRPASSDAAGLPVAKRRGLQRSLSRAGRRAWARAGTAQRVRRGRVWADACRKLGHAWQMHCPCPAPLPAAGRLDGRQSRPRRGKDVVVQELAGGLSGRQTLPSRRQWTTS